MPYPTTQAQSVIYYISLLDIEMLDQVLLDEYTYQDMPKSIFLNKLGVAFEKCALLGNTLLDTYVGGCENKGCHKDCEKQAGVRFVTKQGCCYFDLIIATKDEVVTDIYECNDFNCAVGNNVLFRISLD
jgi:hypothetical protein